MHDYDTSCKTPDTVLYQKELKFCKTYKGLFRDKWAHPHSQNLSSINQHSTLNLDFRNIHFHIPFLLPIPKHDDQDVGEIINLALKFKLLIS